MVSRDEYQRIIESFMMEMPGIVITTEATLRKLRNLGPELDEYIHGLRDPEASPEVILRTAFGLIDEFVRDTWDNTIDESYRLYSDLARGRSSSGEAAT
jgi:hypothetical protein